MDPRYAWHCGVVLRDVNETADSDSAHTAESELKTTQVSLVAQHLYTILFMGEQYE